MDFGDQVFIALGSNLGDREKNINEALCSLDADPNIDILNSSILFETKPLTSLAQPLYLNAAASLSTTLSPSELLAKCKKIEKELGRKEKTHWDSREIDIDIIFFGDTVVSSDELTIPHSQMHLRSFVLEPLLEIAGSFEHPILKRTVSELRDRLSSQNFFIEPNRPKVVEIAGMIGVGKSTLAQGLCKYFGANELFEDYESNPYISGVYDGQNDLAIRSELFFLNNAFELLDPKKLTAQQRYICDFVFEKTLIYASYWLNESDLEIFKKEYNRVSKLREKPSLVIYLKDSIENCLVRIKKRARDFEVNLDRDLLEALEREYDLLFQNWQVSPVIKIDMKDADFRDPAQVEKIAKEIEAYI